MPGEQGAVKAETEDKSQGSVKQTVSQRFTKQVEQWKIDGCQFKTKDAEDRITVCGALPHRVKQEMRDNGLNVAFLVDCTEGHEEQWDYIASAADIKADAIKQHEALKDSEASVGASRAAGRNPMVAEITLKLNMLTHEFTFDPFIPSPGIGLQMLALAQKAIYDQMDTTQARRKDGLELPEKKALVGANGKTILS